MRNPNWDAGTDFRPAYADQIVWKAGGDSNVLARQTLNSPDLLMNDTPPAPVLKTAYESKKSQLSISPLGNYYASLNTQVPPFDNENLRKAVVAAANRQAYLLARGGKLVGQVATHFLGPTSSAFEEAGGAEGPGFDFLKSPTGDMNVAKKYMKAAGYPSGKYTGSENVLIVGSNADPGPKEMQIVQSGLRGARVQGDDQGRAAGDDVLEVLRLRQGERPGVPDRRLDPGLVATATRGCTCRSAARRSCPSTTPTGPQLDDPKINAAMDKAATITDPAARDKAWGEVDKMITETAPAIPEIWASNAILKGSQVKGVLDVWNDSWSLSFSSPN